MARFHFAPSSPACSAVPLLPDRSTPSPHGSAPFREVIFCAVIKDRGRFRLLRFLSLRAAARSSCNHRSGPSAFVPLSAPPFLRQCCHIVYCCTNFAVGHRPHVARSTRRTCTPVHVSDPRNSHTLCRDMRDARDIPLSRPYTIHKYVILWCSSGV